MEVGELALLALCKEQDVYSFFRSRLSGEHFAGDGEEKLFNFVKNHVDSYVQLPNIATVQEAFPGLAGAAIHEPSKYYLDKLDERYAYQVINLGLSECTDLVASYKLTEALDQMERVRSKILLNKFRETMVEFGADALQMIQSEYIKKFKQGDDYGIFFGWPYLDDMVGGLGPGDVVSYVGRPAVGKTWKVLYTAHYAWNVQKKNVLVMSMEMPVLPLVQRLGAMHAHVAITHLKKAELTTVGQEKLHTALLEAQGNPAKMWVVDGNLTSTPGEIFALVHQLKPDVVFIDGAYLLRHENPRLDRFTRVAENVEAIKKMTGYAQIPTICSYQFNRKASEKKEKKQDVGLEDIGYSDAIGQISSIVLGLFEDDSVETIKQRKIHVLKGREGAVGSFSVKWDFVFMDFSEVLAADADTAELTFV